METHFILMADIIKSGKKPAVETASDFAAAIAFINKIFKQNVYSPLTITLGDEFQGVVDSAKTGLAIMIALEEFLFDNDIAFKLRYVFIKGSIATPLNYKIAYGMLGEGLTEARTILEMRKKHSPRFYVKNIGQDDLLNKLLLLYQSIVDDWGIKDYKLITDLISNDDYKVVAKKNSKTPSLIWKRKKSLKITEYKTIKSLLVEYAG